MTVIKAMNRAYDVREDRPLVGRYLLGLGLTVAGSLGIIFAFVTIVGGALLTQQVVGRLGLDGAWAVISLLRWPLVFGLLVLAATIMYRVGPNLTPSWRAAGTGAVLFAAGWVVGAGGLPVFGSDVGGLRGGVGGPGGGV